MSLENQVRDKRNDRRSFIKLLAAAPREHRIETLTGSNPSAVPRNRPANPNATARPRRPSRMQIISMTLQPGEDLIVGNRLRQVLEAARKKAA